MSVVELAMMEARQRGHALTSDDQTAAYGDLHSPLKPRSSDLRSGLLFSRRDP